jgi:hypothetical protein
LGHHGDEPFSAYDEGTAERMRELKEALNREREKELHRKASIGATREFPGGQLSRDDEGEIAFAVGSRKGKVVLDFGSPVAWVGMDPQQAIALANTLVNHAKKARLVGVPKVDTRHTAKTQA